MLRCTCAVRTLVVLLALLLPGLAVVGTAHAATIFSYAQSAGDGSPHDFNGTSVDGADVLDLTGGSVLLEGPYDQVEDTNALHVLADGTLLLSTETPNFIDGAGFGGDDLVRYDPTDGSTTNFFDGSALFAAVENIDAAYLYESGALSGDLLLSTTSAATLGNNALGFGSGDIVRFDPDSGDAFLVFDDANISGTASQKNVDAVHLLPSGNLLLSVALSNGSIACSDCPGGTLTLEAEDVFEWDGASASLWLDADNPPRFDGGSTVGPVDALSITSLPEPATALLLGGALLVAAARGRGRGRSA